MAQFNIVLSFIILLSGTFISDMINYDVMDFYIFTGFILSINSIFCSKSLIQAKAVCYFLLLFWFTVIILDLLRIDILGFLLIIFSLALYSITAKKVLKSPITPMLDFKHNYVIKCSPFKWYHWCWILSGNAESSFNWLYNSKRQTLLRVEGGILVERKANHDLMLREIKAIEADVSIAEVDYDELKKKLGTRINCKKEIY